MNADKEACGLACCAADGEPMAGGELLRAIQQDETGAANCAEALRKEHLVAHAHVGSQPNQGGLKAAGGEMRHELLHQRGLTGPGSAYDAGAPFLGFESVKEHIPIDSRRESKRDFFDLAGGKWILFRKHAAN